jgi:5-methyltetrahydrofolate--homocysteine methyltransferase
MDTLDALYTAIVEGNAKAALAATKAALDSGIDPKKLLDGTMIPAMDEVGKRFEANEYFVPELLISARAMKTSLELLRPLLSQTGAQPVGKVAIGTVKGDLHDIGKNLVAAMLEGGGFEVIDLGVDVPPDRFVGIVREKNVGIVALSALLSTTMANMKVTIDALAQAGVRDRVKVIVGGAPVTQRFATEIGADGFSETASGAVQVARGLAKV